MPGNPKNIHLLIFPKAKGLPGFTAIFQKSTFPILSNALFTKSASPTETPPVVISKSSFIFQTDASSDTSEDVESEEEVEETDEADEADLADEEEAVDDDDADDTPSS